MGDFLKIVLGGKGQQKPVAAEDPDFADFAGAPNPSPASLIQTPAASGVAPTSTAPAPTLVPYTKWYRVWERTTPSDFYNELFVLPFLLLIIAIHLLGSRGNRRKARGWAAAHTPVLQQEFAAVGFDKVMKNAAGTVRMTPIPEDPLDLMRQKTTSEYTTYATGRENVAFVDVKLTLAKRNNPVGMFGEEVLGFLFESMPAPRDRMEATSYVFDGREADLAPLLNAGNDGEKKETFKSTYDAFVFAVVHKDTMKALRDSRYDLSLTSTKDHAKLPNFLSIMSESAEITEAILTPELVKALSQVGDLLESVIITDQPIDQPKKLNDLLPRKRVSLSVRLPSSEEGYADILPLFRYFIRLPDLLVHSAHYRPEALRRVKATREEEVKKIKRVFDNEKAEDRRLKAEKEKKEERDRKLRALSPDEQRKLLERERAQDLRRGQKKQSVRG